MDINYFLSYESQLLGVIILLHITNLIYNFDNNNSFLISFMLLIIYFILSNKQNKFNYIKILIFFSITGVLIENFIISRTKLLIYKNSFNHFFVPLWLLPAYSFFALGVIHLYEYFII